MTDSKKKPEDLLEFPCHYEFKAVGNSAESFQAEVVATIGRSVNVSDDAVRSKPSAKGNYQSVSVLVTLQSYQQLTQIYSDLRAVSGLKMLL